MDIFRGRYVISRGEIDIWAQQGNVGIDVVQGSINEPDDGQVLFSIKPDQLFRMDSWAHPEGLVVGFTGVLARQIKDLSKDVSLSPENFVLEALNAFIQAGEMASGHAHGNSGEQPDVVQKIELETPE
tara:strand:- start:284 stop:667 length:384 start_codon:yes stop_codon:yes gene_type:complete